MRPASEQAPWQTLKPPKLLCPNQPVNRSDHLRLGRSLTAKPHWIRRRRRPAEPAPRRCGSGIVRASTKLTPSPVLIQVNVPKTRRTYCKGKDCKKHTQHKVTQYKAGKVRSLRLTSAALFNPYSFRETLPLI